MSNILSGSCLCGDVTYRITGNVDDFYLCHCTRCRKGTGSAHASNLISREARLHWLTGEAFVKVFELPATLHTRSFCTACGSALPTFEGDVMVIPAGGIDGGIDRLPNAHIYTKDRAEWDRDLENITCFDELPDE